MTARALRVVEARARTYRHVWKASVFSNFVNPILFLAAMGLGLGSLVDRSAGATTLGGASYLAFLAPGLLAATAMLTGAGEGAFPVMAGIKWTKTFHAALSTPIGNADLVIGHLMWVALRLVMVAAAFAVVTVAFGAMTIGAALLTVPAAVLGGLAFTSATTAYAAFLHNDMGLTLMFRFAITPMFLFSGTFFPITQLPGWMQPLAYAVPLWHGVELARNWALSLPFQVHPAIHVGYLVAWVVVGAMLAIRFFERRLTP